MFELMGKKIITIFMLKNPYPVLCFTIIANCSPQIKKGTEIDRGKFSHSKSKSSPFDMHLDLMGVLNYELTLLIVATVTTFV